MASRWRTWDMECLDSTLIAAHVNDDLELISAVGTDSEFVMPPISSIVLPKAALISNDSVNNTESKFSKQCGRGRSLKNRALSQDKPGRRPGVKDETSLGSKFLGSEYLYEELFPGLDESNTPSVGQTSRSLKTSGCKPSQQKHTINFAKIASESAVPKTGHLPMHTTPKYCTKNQTSFPADFPQEARHSDNTAISIKSTSQNTTNQSSFPAVKDSTPSKATTTSKTCFRQINLSRNPIAMQSKVKSVKSKSLLRSETRQSQEFNKKKTNYTPSDCFDNEQCPPKLATDLAVITRVTNSADINNQITSLQNTSDAELIYHHNIPTKSMELSEIGYTSQIPTSPLADESIKQSNVQHQSTEQLETSISASPMSNLVTCNDDNTDVLQDDHQPVPPQSLAEENPQMLTTSSISTQALTEDCFNHHDELAQPSSNATASSDSNISNAEATTDTPNTTDTPANDRVADNDQKTNKSSSQSPGHDSEKEPNTGDGSDLSADTCSVIESSTELSGKDDTPGDCSAVSLDIHEQSNEPPSTFDNGASAKLLSDLYHESIQLTPGQFITFEDRNETSIMKQQSTQALNTVDQSIQKQENSDINGERAESVNDHAMTSHLDTINSSWVSNCNPLSSHISGTPDINACEKPSIVPKLSQDTDEMNEEQNWKDKQNKPIGLEEKFEDCEEMPSEPCDVKLENLPLNFTEEDLVEIIEPYGSMISYTFHDEDSTCKTTIVRMEDQISGEWLAASLDGLEINDHRMRATIVED